VALVASLLALAAAPASVSARKVTISYFKTPSGNIVCMYAAGLAGTQPGLDCAIKSGLKPPPPRVNCKEGDPTDLFVDLGRTGRAHRPSCAGDPGPLVSEKQAHVLKYGHKFHRRGLRCSSAVKGLTCRNVSGHGFFLSRQHSRVF
jgi:hypothetical protein